MRNAAQVVHDPLPSPSVSVSMKKHKPNKPIPSQPFAAPSPSFHPQAADPTHPFASSTTKRGSVMNAKGKKHKQVSQKPQQVWNLFFLLESDSILLNKLFSACF